MCGIAGFCGPETDSAADRHVLTRMVRALAHRGPDAQGLFLDDLAGLGHARLSIIDIAGGAQPMADADGTLWITFNGEIFNYVELSRELVARGACFRTASDTEVILHLYRELGPDCVHRLNGDFAFALWDAPRRRLMLARDRMGVRPLFHTERDGRLYFASEVKALLEVPGIAAEIDPVALDQIFTFWFPLAPRTPFRSIQELPPGHMLLATPGRTVVRPYWRLDYPDADDLRAWDARAEDAVAEELRELLIDAVRIRLRADVPVGAYLSGGLDSSIIAAAAKRLVPERLRTFSVTFDSPEFDESPYQRAMVDWLGVDHRSVPCSNTDIGRVFPQVVRHTERPVLRTAPAPLFLLSDLVREQGYKVVLTGEGADEVFAGYDIFKEAKLRRFCARRQDSPRRALLLRRLYPYLPRLQGQSQRYLEAFFGTEAGETADPLYSHLPRFRSTAGAKRLFSGDLLRELSGCDAPAELRERLPDAFARWHPLNQAQYLETAYLLPGYILSSQGDRMAMAHGVEGRFPFLDHRVVEFAARIPPRLKLRVLREKHILRRAMCDLVPESIIARPKQPYRAPEGQALFDSPDTDEASACLAKPAVGAAGLFEPSMVARLLDKARRQPQLGARDAMALVGVLSTQLWHRQFVAKRAMVARPEPSAVA